MQHLKYVVRWTDKEGSTHSKEYGTEPQARKAKAWLFDNGALAADIAVSLNNKEYATSSGVIPQGVKPGIEQPSFL